ncbi:iron transporter [halophilic archaeon]|nr:iron transporter [halophilic archaeon]
MQRRDFLRAGTVLTAGVSGAGCLQTLGFQTQSAWRDPPLVENRPNAVYYPAVVEGMGTYGTATAGDYQIALMYSYPHRFWNVTGQSKNKVVVDTDDSLHLMTSIWDSQTETVLPVDMQLRVKKNGETIDNRAPWPMLSQTMGFHYGDNVTLDGGGQYTAVIKAGPLQVNRTGAFTSRFTKQISVEIPFKFDTNEVYNLKYRKLGEKQGTRGAVKPMMQSVPPGRAPPKKALPGRILATKTSSDADFVVTLIEAENRFTTNGQYLAVSARTPYNRFALPRMSLSSTINREGGKTDKTRLKATLDPQLGYHYGTTVNSLKSGDTVQIAVDSPPQVARHDGYETTFLEMKSVKVTV